MILLIGGSSQGKLDYARQKYGVSEKEIGGCLDEKRVIYGLHTIIRDWMKAGRDPLKEVLAYAKDHPDTIWICDEVGCGVVPVEEEQRAWREAVGRCCAVLAQEADRVERIFCGLPMTLKGEGPCA